MFALQNSLFSGTVLCSGVSLSVVKKRLSGGDPYIRAWQPELNPWNPCKWKVRTLHRVVL